MQFQPEDDDWGPAQRALTVLLQEALKQPEIIHGLERAQISELDAGQAILDNKTVLAKVRLEQDEVFRLRVESGWAFEDLPRVQRAKWSVAHVLWLTLAFLLGVGYLSLMGQAWSAMAIVDQIFVLIGFAAVIALSARLAIAKVPGFLGTLALSEFEDEEWADPTYGLGERWDVVLTTLVLPELHRHLAAVGQERNYSTVLRSRRVVDLYTEDDDEVVVTEAAERLVRVLGRSRSGAIALAGQRGTGKTTAIKSIVRGRFRAPDTPPPLTVVAAAPARYEARDFVLHLHALLCKAVIARADEALVFAMADTSDRRGPLMRVVRRILIPAAVVGVTVYLGSLALGSTVWAFVEELTRSATAIWNGFPEALPGVFFGGSFLRGVVMVVSAFVALYAAGVVLGLALAVPGLVFRSIGWLGRTVLGRRHKRRERVRLRALRARARQQLDRIRFLQTFTSGWSGKISTPLKGEASRTWQSQRAEQQLTHPEVVEEFRRYAQATAADLIDGGMIDRIVIAIDELDKIGQPEKAHEFVNDIKGVFGVPGCLFLVSVSDDAFTTFEQRGIAVRDAFDSAFAEMIRMDHFTVDESRQWISARLPDAPEQFSVLCHCMSGGLPRDLRRCVVEMLDVTFDLYNPALSTVAGRMVRQEVQKKSHAFAGMARSQEPANGLSDLMADLLTARSATTPGEMVELATSLGKTDENYPRLRAQSSTFLLFCATVLEVFTDALDEDALRATKVETLATVRQQMAVDPQVANRLLVTFRKEHGLELG